MKALLAPAFLACCANQLSSHFSCDQQREKTEFCEGCCHVGHVGHVGIKIED